MDRMEFEALVARMEALERANPRGYHRRVLAWAAMGYGYLLLVVLFLVGICALLVYSLATLKWLAAKLLFIVAPILLVVLRSLWVRFDPPEGERVTRAEAPDLFALLDSLRGQLKTPPVHEVLLIPELNAAVTQVPRLGFLGWHRNFLLLGLPLMKGLTVEQFTAVLAHELGHLSRGHARVGNWIYRLRQIWTRLDAEFENQQHTGSGLVRKFFNWYAPRFNATSFPLARANEFEADAASARLTSPAATAQALTGINVLAQYLDQRYWPGIHDHAKEQPQPAFSPYGGFVGNAILEVPEAERDGWQAAALARTTSYADTHPALRDRLAAIKAEACFAPPAAGKGAETLLGARKEQVERRFDEAWRERIAQSWRQFHEETRQARVRLAQLREQLAQEDLPEDALLELASAEERVGEGASRALELRREALARFPDSALAQFLLGRQLCQMRDASGVALIEAAMERDNGLEMAGAELLREFHWQSGDKERAHQWHDRYLAAAQRMQAARRERETLLTTDSYVPHGLPAEQLAPIVEQLRKIPGIKRVYLVRKVTQHRTDVPFYALGFACAGLLERVDEGRNAAVLEQIRQQIEFPGEAMILSVERPNRRFEKLFSKVSGGRVI